MKIKEACLSTGLTKKAIEYYVEKGLVVPQILESGYREFSVHDVERLKVIALLRKFSLSIEEICYVLETDSTMLIIRTHALKLIKEKKEKAIKAQLARLRLMERYIEGHPLNEIEHEMQHIETYETIKEKLLMAFPGFYGRYLSLHFGSFLTNPITTDDEKELFNQLIAFIDGMNSLTLPEALQNLLDEMDSSTTDEMLLEMSKNVQNACHHFEDYYESNKDSIQEYLAYKQSDAYLNSPVAQLEKVFKSFVEEQGYYETLIPLMRALSPSYNTYYNQMNLANDQFRRLNDIHHHTDQK